MTAYQTKQQVLKALAAMVVFFGVSIAASAADAKTADFNGGLPSGWSLVGSSIYNDSDRARSGKGVWSNGKSATDNYLVTEAIEGTLTFYWRSFGTSGSYPNGTVYVYQYDGTTLGTLIQQTESYKGSTWKEVSVNLGSYSGQVAIALYSACIDDVTYTPVNGGSEGGGEGGGGEGGGTPEPQPEPAPVMSVSTTKVDFGRVEANASETVTVSNTGNAALEATITIDNNDFTVSPTHLTVAAGETGTFSISYLYQAEAYGAHTATTTVTPNAGESATIAVSAFVRNPNVWSENFSGNTLPNGWKAEGTHWTFSDGVAHSEYDYYVHNDYLTTPALVVAAGEELTFKYKTTGSFVDIKIEASKDGGEFTQLDKISKDATMSDYEMHTISGLPAGTYKFRFANENYDLDDFEGFTLDADAPVLMVTPTADANFGKVKSQPEAKTYTITNDGTGTLTGTITTSDATLFTVSKGDFSLAAGESTTFDVALVMSENYGDKTATITIHPTNEGLADVVINATATLVDPNVWTEDFNEGTLPEGWINNSWTFGTSSAFADNTTPMALAPQSTTEGTLITPRLQAKAGDVLSWDAYLRWNDEALLVEYTDDNQATWHTIYNYMAKDEQQDDKYVKAMTFTAPADGTYRLRFTSKMQNGLDNFQGFALAPSTAVKETWHISYTFHHYDGSSEQTIDDTEDIEVEFDGDKVGFNFPNPINGKAWMYGTKYEQDNIVYYIFPMGQYVGQYGGESIYFCGGANDTLTDMQFFYNDDDKAFFNFEYVLLNGSTNSVSLWGYFSDVVIYKNEKPVINPTGIGDVRSKTEDVRSAAYDLYGRKVDGSYKGIVIQNGKKYLAR